MTLPAGTQNMAITPQVLLISVKHVRADVAGSDRFSSRVFGEYAAALPLGNEPRASDRASDAAVSLYCLCHATGLPVPSECVTSFAHRSQTPGDDRVN